jgi:hypothetical protein
MKVIVTGGRDYANAEKVKSVLDHFKPELIIHGDCSGADTLAKKYALANKIPHLPYPYPGQYGRAGGPIRNQQMCEENQDATLIAFKGDKGTKNCIMNAKKLGMKVFEVVE